MDYLLDYEKKNELPNVSLSHKEPSRDVGKERQAPITENNKP